MALLPNEIRDIVKLLEDGKPLPDEYRFKLFGDKREVELVWNGKTNEITDVVLPFQTIEQIDEPRSEAKKDTGNKLSLFDLDTFDIRGRQLVGWTNKLIWGDNKLILSSLKNGPLREEIEKNGGIKLIYIDPPFDVGADFSMNIDIGDEQFTKQPSVLEELAYRDTWGKGSDSFVAMIYERLSLMKDLLAEDGSIYVHCDWRVNSYIRLVLDEVFDKSCFKSEIVWQKVRSVKGQSNYFSNVHDSIFFYSKSSSPIFNDQFKTKNDSIISSHYRYVDEKTGKRYRLSDFTQNGEGQPRKFGDIVIAPPPRKHWIWTQERIDQAMAENRLVFSKNGMPSIKRYLDEVSEDRISDIWEDIFPVNPMAQERVDYPTQKPEALVERIVEASSREGDIVADFFMGSGTLPAVSEKLGRKWIGSDLGKFSIHTTRKRMISVQRMLKKQGKNYRAFEILNLGKYERQLYVGVNQNLDDDQKQQQRAKKESDFVALILRAYKAETASGFEHFEGKKNNRVIAIGPINLPVGRAFIHELLKEALDKKLTKIDVLAFEFEMGLFPNIQEEAKDKGVDLGLKYIPRDVFDKRAIEKNQVIFHDVAFIEVKPLTKGKAIAIELTDFSVFYNQDTIANVESDLKNGGSKIVVENGKIIKVSKDKNGITVRTTLTKKWTDWIDYWAVDFDFESKKEVLRKKNEGGNYDEVWTGDYIFENEWQAFRTKKDRSLELKSIFHECLKGERKIAIKVVDIFGNDTMKIIEVNI